jgi:MerR family transcriptional regulator, light-induced transcriptional regulator
MPDPNASDEPTQADLALLSIGDIATATGFTPDTLRVWERRYGAPVPLRLASGHRRYTREQVIWLRRVAEAIAIGHRPSKVLRMSALELLRLLESSSVPDAPVEDLHHLIELVRDHRDLELRARLDTALRQSGPLAVLQNIVAPLLVMVGRAWSSGALEIRHEHALVESLQDWMRAHRAARAPRAIGPLMLLATLSGERHELGIVMSSWLAAERGFRVKVLGTDLPAAEIDAAARALHAKIVLIGISLATGGIETDRSLARLRSDLPPDVVLAIGGAGARSVRRGPRGVECFESLAALDQWLARRAVAPRSSALL